MIGGETITVEVHFDKYIVYFTLILASIVNGINYSLDLDLDNLLLLTILNVIAIACFILVYIFKRRSLRKTSFGVANFIGYSIVADIVLYGLGIFNKLANYLDDYISAVVIIAGFFILLFETIDVVNNTLKKEYKWTTMHS